MMNTRVIASEFEKIKQTDSSQETDITALEAAVGTVPEESDSLQEQISALELRVKALEDAAQGSGTA